MSVAEYQEIIGGLLKQIYPPGSVKTEWKSEFDGRIYSPRIDIAVGPFSVVDGTNLEQLYDDLFIGSSGLLTSLVDLHLCNLGLVNNDFTNETRDRLIFQKMERLQGTNRNSRCFLAVEIENKVSRKHLMGGSKFGGQSYIIHFTKKRIFATADNRVLKVNPQRLRLSQALKTLSDNGSGEEGK